MLAAVACPAGPLIDLFRANPAGVGEQATLGVLFLRVGLGLLGVLISLLGAYPPPSPAVPTAPAARRPTSRVWKIFAGILVAATILRLYQLNQQLWLDEIILHLRYMGAGLDRILTTFDFNNHLFYTLQAKLSLIVFGDSAWALRLPAALFGIASIAALFVFASHALGSREALLASGLMAASYHHIWFSQNARGYTGLLFWTLISGHLLLRAFEEPRRRYWVGYAVAIALGIYTSDLLVVVVAGHFLMYVVRVFGGPPRALSDRLTGLCFGFTLAGAIAFTLNALTLPQKLAAFGLIKPVQKPLWALSEVYKTPPAPTWNDPMWFISEVVKILQRGMGGVVILGAIVVFALGCWRLLREKREILALFFFPVLILGVLKLTGSFVFPRFFFFAAGYAILIAVSGVLFAADGIGRILRLPRPELAGTAAGLLAIVASMTMVPAVYAPKQDFTGAMRFIEEQRRPGEAVVVVSDTTALPYREFYGKDWTEAESALELEAIASDASKVWLVYTLPMQLAAKRPDLWDAVRVVATEEARFPGTLGGGDVVVNSIEGGRD